MVEAVGAADKGDYFSAAKRFDEVMVASGRRSVKVANLTASAAVGVAVLQAGALIALVPMKTVEPFVVRVDNSTGIVDVVSALTGPQTYDDQVKRYFAAKYVQGREGFVGSEAQPTFKAVTLMSAVLMLSVLPVAEMVPLFVQPLPPLRFSVLPLSASIVPELPPKPTDWPALLIAPSSTVAI